MVTLGNLAGAITASLIIDLSFQAIIGHPLLGAEAALHGLESMHPLASLTIPFAAMTGCFLWVSSLVAGWTANWMARHNLAAAVSHSRRLRRILGAAHARRLGTLLAHHLSGVAGYICLGLLLGLLPFVSVFAGLPVEVRHVTLASASLTYDISSLVASRQLPWGGAVWAALGLVATGVCNFTVSFALGLWLAARARRLDARGRKMLAWALRRELRRDPARFLWRDQPGPQISVSTAP
jgi:site-specific recombinase